LVQFINGGLGPAAIDWKDLQAWQDIAWDTTVPLAISFIGQPEQRLFGLLQEGRRAFLHVTAGQMKSKEPMFVTAVDRSLRIGFKALDGCTSGLKRQEITCFQASKTIINSESAG
jgi:hypothetical protein